MIIKNNSTFITFYSIKAAIPGDFN